MSRAQHLCAVADHAPQPQHEQAPALQTAPLILRPMSDWRADPTPYPLRRDLKPRAVWTAGAQS
jgi:hypothetical protein